MLETTYKDFFDRAKKDPGAQLIIRDCLVAAIKTAAVAEEVFPDKPKVDVGDLLLSGICTLCGIMGVKLVGKEDITAEYMAGIINERSHPKNQTT